MDDITGLWCGRKKVVAEMAKKVMKKLKEEVNRNVLKLSVTEDGMEGKSKMIASCGFMEELRQCSKEEGVTIVDGDLRTRVKFGSERTAVRFSLIKRNKAFQKNYVKVEVKKLLRAGMVPARTWRVHAVVMAPTERSKLRRQIAAAGKKSTTSVSLFMEAFGFEVEEELSAVATQTWAAEVWIGEWCTEQTEAWLNQVQVQTWRQVRGLAGAVM